MNGKKENIEENKNPIFILFIIVLIFIGIYAINGEDIINNLYKSNNQKDILCKEFIDKNIPDYIIAYKNMIGYQNNYWKDGEKIIVSSFKGTTNIGDNYVSLFRKGKEAGQNFNYYYGVGEFKYDKQIISESGSILGNNHFIINNIIISKELNKQFLQDRYQLLNLKLRNIDDFYTYKIIDYNIKSCVIIKND